MTTQCDYPEEARNFRTVGGFVDINFGEVRNLNPDIVFTSTLVQEKIALQSQQSGLKTIHIDPKNLNEVFDSIIKIGDALGAQKNAGQVIRKMKTRINHIGEKTKQAKATPSQGNATCIY